MTAFSRDEIELSVGARLAKLARELPNRTAIRRGGESISFAQLEAAADRIAGAILERSGPAPAPVALLLEQGIPGMAAAFGAMKAGKSSVILPPQFPPDRLAALWQTLQQPPVVCSAPLRDLADQVTGDSRRMIDVDQAMRDREPGLLPAVFPDSIGTIYFTSATTGQPKGVMLSQRMILHTAWQNGSQYGITDADTLAHLSAYGFGAAATASFAAVLNGATLCFPERKTDHLAAILTWAEREGVTLLSITSFGLIRQQARSSVFRKRTLPALRLVLMGGEELFLPDLDAFWSVFPSSVSLRYRLAGSETMLMCENHIPHTHGLPNGKIPVGYPVADKEILLLDEDRRPVPDGEIGEIAVRSRYLASGYWRQPELSAKRFLEVPEHPGVRLFLSGDLGCWTPDHQLEYLGRKDNVVKIRGFGIQLEEVERALTRIRGIRECGATALPLPSGDKRLAAYLVAEGNGLPAVEDMRRELTHLLPRFMIPSVFIRLDSLPRTPTGKVDRSRLPPPGTLRPALKTPFAAPRTEREQRLCALWADLLQIDAVGIDDDFFDLGGDSLLALHLSIRVEETFGREIPPAFFPRPTVANLARLWESAPSDARLGTPPTGRRGRRSTHVFQKSTRLANPAEQNRRRRGRKAEMLHDPAILLQHLIALAAVRLPYWTASRWVAWLASQKRLREGIFPSQIRRFNRFVEHLGGVPDAPENALEIYLAGNTLWSRIARRGITARNGVYFVDQIRGSGRRYWTDLARIISRAPDDEFERLFSAAGLEHLESALAKGRGVILVTYHNTANRIAMAALARRLGREPIPTISILRAYQVETHRMHVESDARPSASPEGLIAGLTLEGKRLLEQGQMIQIVPDTTLDVVGDRPLDIGGWKFQIKPGLAEYALLTGAPIIPQFSTRRLDGGFHMAVQPALAAPAGARDDPFYSILRQYAAFVDRSWRLAPEGMSWNTISKLFNRPRVRGPNRAAASEAGGPADGGEPEAE